MRSKVASSLLSGIKFGGRLGIFGTTFYVSSQMYHYEQLKKSVQKWGPEPRPESEHIEEAKDKEWLIIGRQSPEYVRDEKKTPKEKQRKQLETHLAIPRLGTVLDNEKHYDLFEGSDFVAYPCSSDIERPSLVVKPDKMLSIDLDEIPEDQVFEICFARKQGFAHITQKSPLYHSALALRLVSPERPASADSVFLTGAEIKGIISKTNDTICSSQPCDLYNSNCYSATMFALGEVIEVIDRRSDKTPGKSEDIKKVAAVISHAALDNLARGVCNNQVVIKKLSDVSAILAKHGLPEELEVKKYITL